MPLQPHDLSVELIRFRHALHQEPEIGLELPRTQEKVLRELDALPLEISTGRETTSVTAVLRGRGGAPGAERPAVLLRADMDALPVQEQTGVDFTSRVDGAMHACGHDLHTSMLTGAARLLADRVDQLPGDVVLMFQPGEEGCDGASVMLREGVLEAAGRTVDAAYAMHVFSGMAPHGQLLTKPGVMMSASDGLEVVVHGAGGHGSAPHHAKDPVTTAAEMVTALQVMVTRQLDMFDPAVLTVGVLQAGTKRNVIPDSARFEATVRTFSEENRAQLQRSIPRLLQGIASAHGLEVEVAYRTEYPRTVTDLSETERAEQVIRGLLGEERMTRLATPVSGSEDFSHVLDRVPGTFIGLGAVTPGADPKAAAFNHSPQAIFDDGVLADGAALYAELATTRLASLAAESTTPRTADAVATA
ncbi:amidohydrolase [Flexivirga endophytica]|uniref:Amidohydrolase n=1 Tax=Flexivirga endophytica TaxID=1849103 RepID=A0A916WSR4_9MICO|nr:M20 family metallopeptidase [Flexivirga endophytica]GGB26121.1 amidohydrolase [Flexivirga endophytica]GHB54656.1 amidohydrolase [Flexivirga endophytica]